MKKILLVVLDGLGDRPVPRLRGQTPLAYAPTPHLDALAARGTTGLMVPVKPGLAPESDIAVISLLGYDVERYHTGRGPIECHALGMEVRPGVAAFRVNLGISDGYPRIHARRVNQGLPGDDLSDDEFRRLAEELNAELRLTSVAGAEFQLKTSIGHRGALTIRAAGQRLSGWVTNTDPAFRREGLLGVAIEGFERKVCECQPMKSPHVEAGRTVRQGAAVGPSGEGLAAREADAAAIATARLVNEFSVKAHEVLRQSAVNCARVAGGQLPADVILLRDGGDRLPQFPPLSKVLGIQFGCFAEMPVEVGIALLTGMQVVRMPAASGDYEKEYPHWANAIVENLANYDALYVHIKGPDTPAHHGQCRKKAECIGAIDAYLVQRLRADIDLTTTVLAVTADHSTPCELRSHSADPVPVMIVTDGIEPDSVTRYSESAARDGCLGKITGTDLLPRLVEIAQS